MCDSDRIVIFHKVSIESTSNQLSDGECFGVRDEFHDGSVEIKDFDKVLGDGGRANGAIGSEGVVKDGGFGSVVFFDMGLILVIFVVG